MAKHIQIADKALLSLKFGLLSNPFPSVRKEATKKRLFWILDIKKSKISA